MVQALSESNSNSDTGRVCFGIGTRRRADSFEIAHLRPELPEEAIEPHEHDEAHFVLVLEGRYFSSAANIGMATEGPLLIYNPAGTLHRDRFFGNEGRFVAFGVPATAIDGTGGLPQIPIRLSGGALSAALRAARAAALPNADVAGLCWDLLAAVAPVRRERSPGWLGRARAMIDALDDRPTTIAEIAAEVGVHPVHLARVFRAQIGCSPIEYHGRKRVARARALLANSALSLSEIALSSGFGDQSHLTHAFTRQFGIAPGAYRAARRNVADRQDEAPASA